MFNFFKNKKENKKELIGILFEKVVWADLNDFEETISYYLYKENGKKIIEFSCSDLIKTCKYHITGNVFMRVIEPWLKGNETFLRNYLNKKEIPY